MNVSKKHNIFSSIIGIFLLVRVQNIILLNIAFFLTAKYIFDTQSTWQQILTDDKFLALLFSTSIAVAAGYLINSFYDYKQDLINRPQTTLLEENFNQKKRLYLYFLFNFLAVAISFYISWHAAIFISFYIFLIWFYSHKLKSYTLLGNIVATVLYIFPFFGIFLYFKTFNWFIFFHAVFLFLLLWIKDLIKSIISLKGEIITNRQSFVVKYGEKNTFRLVLALSILLLFPILILFHFSLLGGMKYYFYLFVLSYYPMLYRTIQSNKYEKTPLLYFMIKILLVIGVFSLVLIKY